MTDSLAQNRFLDSLAQMPEYTWYQARVTPSIWDRLQEWFSIQFSKLLSSISIDGVSGILEVVGVILIGVIVWRLVVLYERVQSKRTETATVRSVTAEEELLLNNAELSQKAAADGRWRDAVRYSYLVLLKELRDAGMIQWTADKTNRDYLREVASTEIVQPLGRAVAIFERCWYGADVTTPNEYQQLEDEAQRIRLMVKGATA